MSSHFFTFPALPAEQTLFKYRFPLAETLRHFRFPAARVKRRSVSQTQANAARSWAIMIIDCWENPNGNVAKDFWSGQFTPSLALQSRPEGQTLTLSTLAPHFWRCC